MIVDEMYIAERLDVQIAYFFKKSIQHRRRYKILKITEIVAGFLIAVCCAIPMPEERYRLFSVGLSSLGLLCEGVLNLYNAKKHWIFYQKTAHLLEREKFLYRCQTEKYIEESQRFELFVKTCEELISEEITKWESIQSKEITTSTDLKGK